MSSRHTTRVAIADDHYLVREGLKQVIAAAPTMTVVAEATDSHEALVAGLDARTDLLVLDVSMPGRGGFEVLRQLRRSRSDLPVLMLSYYPETEMAVRALMEGANGYLGKDRVSQELLDALSKIVSGGHYVTPATAERLAKRVCGLSEPPPHEALTPIELQVLCLFGSGRSTAEIAEELFLSPKTIGTYRTRILSTMEMENHAQLIHYTLDHGLALAIHDQFESGVGAEA